MSRSIYSQPISSLWASSSPSTPYHSPAAHADLIVGLGGLINKFPPGLGHNDWSYIPQRSPMNPRASAPPSVSRRSPPPPPRPSSSPYSNSYSHSPYRPSSNHTTPRTRPHIKFDPFSDENSIQDPFIASGQPVAPTPRYHNIGHNNNHIHNHNNNDHHLDAVLYRTSPRRSISIVTTSETPSLPPPPRPPRQHTIRNTNNNNPFLSSSETSPSSLSLPPTPTPVPRQTPKLSTYELPSSSSSSTRRTSARSTSTSTSLDLDDKTARSKLVAGILLNRVHAVGRPMRPQSVLRAIDINNAAGTTTTGVRGRAYVKSGLSRVVSVEA